MSFEGDTNEDFTAFVTKELAGTKTERNLQDAYCGESKARNNYTFFAQQAKKEGYEQIARIFEETANNEKEHAKIWLKLLYNGNLPETIKNLETAASTENYEWEDMYARFAKEAKEEGFEKIACLFETIRNIEKMHMTRYNKLIEQLRKSRLFQKEHQITWECAKCGYTFEGETAPEICPFCRHPQGFFFEKCENY